jgi:hypothetical protein
MSDLIDREILLRKIEAVNCVDYGSMFSYEAHSAVLDCLSDIKYIIESIPAVSVSY